MEITIKRYSRKLTYEDAVTLDEFWELAGEPLPHRVQLQRLVQGQHPGRELFEKGITNGEVKITSPFVRTPWGTPPEALVSAFGLLWSSGPIFRTYQAAAAWCGG